MNLTPKQKAFVHEYIKNGGNASDAARRAGYKNHEVEGTRLIRNDKVLAYIAEKQ